MSEKKIKYLYKYRPLSNGNRDVIEIDKNTLSLINNGELHFSSPTDFNDPFDSLVNIERKYEKLHSSEDTIEARLYKKNNDVTWEDLHSKTWDDLPNESWSNMIKSLSVSQLRILCVSKTFSNILMWSHYADSHKGICIGFNFNEAISNKYSLKIDGEVYYFNKVKYGKQINIKMLSGSDMKESLFYKRKDWKYEKEYRMVLNNRIVKNDEGNINIDLLYIKEIIFGVLTPIKYIAEICKFLESNNRNRDRIISGDLKLYQMERNIGKLSIFRKQLSYEKFKGSVCDM